jgi:hypothetical protein
MLASSPPRPPSTRLRGEVALLFAVLAAGCGESSQPQAGSGSAAAPASVSPPVASVASATPAASSSAGIPIDVVPWVGIPRPVEEVEKVINPLGEKPYEGKTGTLKGKITIKGDPPPDVKLELPADCAAASATYGKAFRVGEGGALADALVTVTGYKGFVPVSKPSIDVTLNACAYDQLTYSMTFGQRIEVKNIDPKLSHVPILDPAPFRSVNVAMPKGNPVKIYAFQPAINYVLRDYMSRRFLTARVFNLKFATHDVTSLDGTYEIPRIPVGKVKVNAFLPALESDGVAKEIEIKEGENTLDLELTYAKDKDKIAALPEDPWARKPGTAPTSSGGFGEPPRQFPSKSEKPR